MRIDRHVFGSVSGYGTLARSEGIGASELRALAGITIGQTADSSVLASLSLAPAYAVRPLGSRRALTRISVGPPDDKGRPTLQSITIVLSRGDWDVGLAGDIGLLIEAKGLWDWDGSADLPVIDAPLVASNDLRTSGSSAPRVLSLLSLLERGWNSRGPVVVDQRACSREDFRLIEMLLPPSARGRYSAVYRGLTPNLPVSLVCVAEEARVPGHMLSYGEGREVPLSRYAQALSKAGFGEGFVPLDFVRSYRSFAMEPERTTAGIPRPGGGPMPPPQVVVERTPRKAIFALSTTCFLLALLLALSISMGRSRSNALHESLATLADKMMAVPLPALDASAREQFERVCDDARNFLPAKYPQRDALGKRLEKLSEESDSIDKFETKMQSAELPTDQTPSKWLQSEADAAFRSTDRGTPAAYASVGDFADRVERRLKAQQKEELERRVRTDREDILKQLVGNVQAVLRPDTEEAKGEADDLFSQKSHSEELVRVLQTISKEAKGVDAEGLAAITGRIDVLRSEGNAFKEQIENLKELSELLKPDESNASADRAPRDYSDLRKTLETKSAKWGSGTLACRLAQAFIRVLEAAHRLPKQEKVEIKPAPRQDLTPPQKPDTKVILRERLREYSEWLCRLRKLTDEDRVLENRIKDTCAYLDSDGAKRPDSLLHLEDCLANWGAKGTFSLRPPDDITSTINLIKEIRSELQRDGGSRRRGI